MEETASTSSLCVLVTGVTGMVGEGVLHECLQHPSIASVVVLSRKPSGVTHPKLREILQGDFFDLSSIRSQLGGIDACLFCLGVSSVGMKEAEYFKMTHTLTLHVAETLVSLNPGMSFCYISGAGTDSSEKGRMMWARVKGKTENDLMKLTFRSVFAFRPGFIKPTPGMKNTLKIYRYLGWLFPFGRLISPKGFCTLRELGLAMIHALQLPPQRTIAEGKTIIAWSREEERPEVM